MTIRATIHRLSLTAKLVMLAIRCPRALWDWYRVGEWALVSVGRRSTPGRCAVRDETGAPLGYVWATTGDQSAAVGEVLGLPLEEP